MAGSGAYCAARQAADQGERIAVLRQTGAIAGAHQLDRFERHAEVVAVEILQLGSQSDPSPWSAAVPAQGSAQPIVLLAGEHQHTGKLARRCPGALTA